MAFTASSRRETASSRVDGGTCVVGGLVVVDGSKYAEETIDGVIREQVFVYFDAFCLWVKLGSADGRIDSTVDWLAR